MTCNFDQVKTGEHVCCWHETGMVYCSYPPQIQEICCVCGIHRSKPGYLPLDEIILLARKVRVKK